MSFRLMCWPNMKRASIRSLKAAIPRFSTGIAKDKKISDEMDQLMKKALTEYGDEFKDTIK